ncbi:MAG: uracil-DNA glycosylase [Pseudomonadota bacterium]
MNDYQDLAAIAGDLRRLLARNRRGLVLTEPGWEALRSLEAGPPPPNEAALAGIRERIGGDCRRCKLCRERTNMVFGVGDPCARLMFIGEGPGRDEDLQGEPFVGRAGVMLTNAIKAMGLSREQVYIANVVKCRPPSNRNPEPDEIAACLPFLQAQIQAVAPEAIVLLGAVAVNALLGQAAISKIRGRWQDLGGIRTMPTFHPAYLLRNELAKRDFWTDLKVVRDVLGITGGKS